MPSPPIRFVFPSSVCSSAVPPAQLRYLLPGTQGNWLESETPKPVAPGRRSAASWQAPATRPASTTSAQPTSARTISASPSTSSCTRSATHSSGMRTFSSAVATPCSSEAIPPSASRRSASRLSPSKQSTVTLQATGSTPGSNLPHRRHRPDPLARSPRPLALRPASGLLY